MSTGRRRGDLLLAGGLAVALAASADTAWSLHARFALDLEGLSALERARVQFPAPPFRNNEARNPDFLAG